MEWNKQNIRSLLLVICGGVAFYVALQNLGAVVLGLRWLMGILSPFLLGGTIAFILNVPMRAIERQLFPRKRRGGKLRRPLALVLTLLAVIGVLTLAVCVIGPGVGDAARSVVEQIPTAMERLEEQLTLLETYLPQLEAFIVDLNVDWTALSQKMIALAKGWGGNLISTGGGLIGGVVSGVSTFVIGLIFSFYLLMQKEKLARQGRQVLYALLPERKADHALDILRLASRTF